MEEQLIAGMTVNERRFGLLDLFDAAVRAETFQHWCRCLCRQKLSEEQAARTAKAVAADPQRYGY